MVPGPFKEFLERTLLGNDLILIGDILRMATTAIAKMGA